MTYLSDLPSSSACGAIRDIGLPGAPEPLPVTLGRGYKMETVHFCPAILRRMLAHLPRIARAVLPRQGR